MNCLPSDEGEVSTESMDKGEVSTESMEMRPFKLSTNESDNVQFNEIWKFMNC